MRHLILSTALIFASSSSIAADVCKRPVSEIVSESKKVIGMLKKQGCGYTFKNKSDSKDKKEMDLVTKTSQMLRQRHLCATNKGDEVEAETLRKTAKNLLETFSTICAG